MNCNKYQSYAMFPNLFVNEDVKLTGNGASRVRKGTHGSLPLGLLTPIVPCCNYTWAFTGNTCYGTHKNNDKADETLRPFLFVLFAKG